MTAFVIGNGTSRQGLDLESLRSSGKIYGCNALYRDFSPDYLFATDPGIAQEIEQNYYPETNEFYTRKPRHPKSKKIELNYGFSSGPVAATYAAEHGHEDVYLIGFDLNGLPNKKHNNIYSGTENYKSKADNETFYGNWITQIQHIARTFQKTNFYRIGDSNLLQPDEWKKLSNINFLTIDEFVNEVNTVSWQRQKE